MSIKNVFNLIFASLLANGNYKYVSVEFFGSYFSKKAKLKSVFYDDFLLFFILSRADFLIISK